MSGKNDLFVSSAVSADSSTSRLTHNEEDMSLLSESSLLLAKVSLVIQGENVTVIGKYNRNKSWHLV